VNSYFVKPIAQLLDLALRIPTQDIHCITAAAVTGVVCTVKSRRPIPLLQLNL
jgi:hypothetical protein